MRRPKLILIAVLPLLSVGIVFGGTVYEKFGVCGFVDPAAEWSQVADYMDRNFPHDTEPNAAAFALVLGWTNQLAIVPQAISTGQLPSGG